MHKVVFESNGVLKNRIIEGVALTPTISGNGNVYLPDVIDNALNLDTPLIADWEHTDERIGTVTYSLIPETHTLVYRAEIESDKRAKEIKEGVHKVSIEANIGEVGHSCSKRRCYNTPQSLEMSGIGITDHPGVSTATLMIKESYQTWEPIKENCLNCEKVDRIKQLEEEINNLKSKLTCPDCGELFS